jgi:hypothetical protein
VREGENHRDGSINRTIRLKVGAVLLERGGSRGLRRGATGFGDCATRFLSLTSSERKGPGYSMNRLSTVCRAWPSVFSVSSSSATRSGGAADAKAAATCAAGPLGHAGGLGGRRDRARSGRVFGYFLNQDIR